MPGVYDLQVPGHPAPDGAAGVEAGLEERTVRLLAGGSIVGRLLDETGAPLANVLVSLSESKPHSYPLQNAKTADDGRAREDPRSPSLTHRVSGSGQFTTKPLERYPLRYPVAMWIRTTGWLQVVLLGLLILTGSPVRADDAAQLAAADTVLAELKGARKAKDVDAASKALERVRAAHDGIQDPDRRKAIQAAIGALLRVEDLEVMHRRVLATLASLDDPKGAYKQMRRCLPETKDGRLRPLGRHVLAVLRRTPLEVALSKLTTLAEKAHSDEVRCAAIQALGSYGTSPQRATVARLLFGLLKNLRPPKNLYRAGPQTRGWHAYGGAVVEALCRLTGKKSDDPAAWMARSGRKPRNLEGLFDPASPLAPAPPVQSTPWKRVRAKLGRPEGAVLETVERALRWLAAHQAPDGKWQAAGFHNWCDGEAQSGDHGRGLGNEIYDVGVTGLALTAFLVAGYDGTGGHTHDGVVRKGLAWLVSVQDDDGRFGARVTSSVAQIESYSPGLAGLPGVRPTPPSYRTSTDRKTYVYNHATAALALIEAAALTGSATLVMSAQRAIDFIDLTRNPYFAWRYGIKPGDNDTSVTMWMMLALGTARLINASYLREYRRPPFVVDDQMFDGVEAWLGKMTDPESGQVGYTVRGTRSIRLRDRIDRFPTENTEALTAGGMVMRLFLGEDAKKSKVLRLGSELCAAQSPRWMPTDGSIDMIYWHFGALAMRQVGRSQAKAWDKAVTAALVENQRKTGDVCGLLGSWDPIGAWGTAGGRVYSTALNTLTLLTPTRYPLSR